MKALVGTFGATSERARVRRWGSELVSHPEVAGNKRLTDLSALDAYGTNNVVWVTDASKRGDIPFI